jgi:hypothetical protein
VCSPTQFCPKKDPGQPCRADSECASGFCNGNGDGWCTEQCTSNGECTYGWCALNGNHLEVCFPYCSSTADCAQFGISGLYCHSTTTIDGYVANICSL